MSQSTGRRRLWWFKLLKLWPHHSSLDKTLQGNSAFGILKIASTMVGTGLTPSGLSRNPVKITLVAFAAENCEDSHHYLSLGLLLCYSTSIFKNTISNVLLPKIFIPARASCCLVRYFSFPLENRLGRRMRQYLPKGIWKIVAKLD